MKVSVLIENKCQSDEKLLKTEHGLSLHIRFNGKNILFDTGASGKFIENAKVMGINIGEIDFVVLSHAHFDHGGGLIKFLEENKKALVYMSKNAVDNHYAKILGIRMNVGISKELFEHYAERISFVDNFTEIMGNTYIIPNPAAASFPMGESVKKFMVKKDGKLYRDNFDHEITLAINNNNKLEIFTACSHSGISNMVKNASDFFPEIPINSVIGGFHLMGIPFENSLGESVQYIKEIGCQMNSYNINKVYTAHCTGEKAYNILKEIMGDTITNIHTGMEFEI